MKKQISYKIVSLVFSVLVICFAIAFYIVAWDEPLQDPSGCTSGDPGCDAPINVGPTAQDKAGDLGIGGVFHAYGGLIIETRTSDPASPETGRMWLRTDI